MSLLAASNSKFLGNTIFSRNYKLQHAAPIRIYVYVCTYATGFYELVDPSRKRSCHSLVNRSRTALVLGEMLLRHRTIALFVAIYCLGVSSAISQAGTRLLSSMAQALQTHGVIPDVVDKVPADVLNVTYPNNLTVEIGKVLTPTQVKDQPAVQWNGDANTFYTLCMTDPDAPSRQNPKFREWHHWLVGNIPGSDIAKGDVLSQYIGSGPPKDTGLHRYVLLLYKQPGKLTFDEKRLTNRSGDNRGKFSIKNFAAKYKLGDPIAGNMYQAEFDDYVPILYKQLEG